MAFAVFNLSGYIPVMRDWLMIKHSRLISAGARKFKSRVEIPSLPDDDLMRSKYLMIRNLVIDIFFLKAYFLHHNIIVLLLVNNF